MMVWQNLREWVGTHSDKNVAADAAYPLYYSFTRAYARAYKNVAAMRLLARPLAASVM